MYWEHNFQSITQGSFLKFLSRKHKLMLISDFLFHASYSIYTVSRGLDFIWYKPNAANVISFCRVISYSVKKHNLKLAYVQEHSKMEGFFLSWKGQVLVNLYQNWNDANALQWQHSRKVMHLLPR